MVTAYSQQLEEFLANVERRAFRMAEFSTQNREDALDIVQDTMTQLVKKYANKPAAQWAPLFYRILNNRIIDFHRRATAQKRWRIWLSNSEDDNEFSDPVQQQPSPDLDPVAMSNLQDSVEHVSVAVKQLPARQRQAFLLRAWQGMDVAETARAMNCSEGSVKTHYSRAVHFLRQQLQDQL